MAREFWAEVYDLRTPAEDRRERPIPLRRSTVQKLVLTRRPARRPLR